MSAFATKGRTQRDAPTITVVSRNLKFGNYLVFAMREGHSPLRVDYYDA